MCAIRPPARPSCATCSRCSAELDAGGFAVGHNGNLTNGLTLRRELVREGAIMQSTTDTEVILHLVARSQPQPLHRPLHRRAAPARRRLCVRRRSPTRSWSARAIRSASARWCSASSTAARSSPRRPARSTSSARKYVRDVENGEVVVFDEERRALAQAVPADGAAALHLRIHLFLAAGFDRRRPHRLRRAQDHGRAARARSAAPTPTSSCRCRIPACRPRSAMRRRPASPTSSASSATTMSAAPSSSRRSRSASSACG